MPTFANANEETWLQSECSAVGSALRSGRRGRAFESPHSDTRSEDWSNPVFASLLRLSFFRVCTRISPYYFALQRIIRIFVPNG